VDIANRHGNCEVPILKTGGHSYRFGPLSKEPARAPLFFDLFHVFAGFRCLAAQMSGLPLQGSLRPLVGPFEILHQQAKTRIRVGSSSLSVRNRVLLNAKIKFIHLDP
jgi:hypothetical protein